MDVHVPSFPVNKPTLIFQVYARTVVEAVKKTLLTVYPENHRVRLIRNPGSKFEKIEELPLIEIGNSKILSWSTDLYLPPLAPDTSFESFHEVVAHLRSPNGCPWDRKQTHLSLRKNLLEEAYEVVAAIDKNDIAGIKEELGDLMLLILLQAQIATDDKEFNILEVLQDVNRKIVRRHPHVFGSLRVQNDGEILENWERLKEKERASGGKKEESLLDGVPLILPALIQSEEYQERAAHVGFEWESVEDVIRKVDEELAEVKNALGDEAMRDEIGDLLFAVVNLARWFDIDAEEALRMANKRFRDRFYYIEKKARAMNQQVSDYSLDELLEFWKEAKETLSN